MDPSQDRRSDQAALWNSSAGCAWVDAQDVLDRMYKPFEDLLADTVTAGPAQTVLDVGCGAGGTTLAIARRLGARGRAVGVDISEPMIAAARGRAEREHSAARFICADAASYAFDAASVDLIVSRFGVMFFDDPVRAFSNLRRAATDVARLRIVAWRGEADNPFMTAAERAAAPLLPNLRPRQPDAPGQFGFANRDRVSAILDESGWRDIDIRPIDIACNFPERELIRYLTRLGPVGRALDNADDVTRAQVIDTVRPAFDPFVDGDTVRFVAACWIVAATAGRR
jgi:SAM-dependent methyltransferase